jgi:tetratricopeptide (TPR) repeat protein
LHRDTNHLAALALLLACACSATPVPQVSSSPRAQPQPSARAVPAPENLPFVSPASYEQLIRAELHVSRGEPREAVAAYRAAIAFGDDEPYLLARLAQALDATGDARGAHEAIASALAIAPNAEAPWLAAARIARKHGDHEASQRAYERACASATSAASALERVEYLRELGNHERARDALRELAKRDAASVSERLRIDLELAIAEKNPDELARRARDWAALVPMQAHPGLGRRAARALLDAGRPHAALLLLDALPVDPSDAELRLDALLALGRTAECEHLLATTPPDWLGGPVALARAYLAIDRADAALSLLEERTARPERGRECLIGRALVDVGRSTSAASAIMQALRDPTQRAAAKQALAAALEASALPALASEIEASNQAQ